MLNLSASTAQGLVADLALEGVTELWHRARGDLLDELGGVERKDETDSETFFIPDIEIDFYIAPNGKVLPGAYKDWLGESQRVALINSVSDNNLKHTIGEIYRPGSIIGDGGTADVLRFERTTGILLSRSGHSQKVKDISKYLQKLIDSNTLSPNDQKVAEDLLYDLNNALGGN